VITVKIKCQGCGRTITSDNLDDACKECDGKFAVLGSKDDAYSEDNEEEYEEEFSCTSCGKGVKEGEYIELPDGDDIGSNFVFCKKCVDRIYPRKIETKIEYKERVVEKPIYLNKDGVPLNTTFNPFDKSKFD
jgi:hypothetical protein